MLRWQDRLIEPLPCSRRRGRWRCWCCVLSAVMAPASMTTLWQAAAAHDADGEGRSTYKEVTLTILPPDGWPHHSCVLQIVLTMQTAMLATADAAFAALKSSVVRTMGMMGKSTVSASNVMIAFACLCLVVVSAAQAQPPLTQHASTTLGNGSDAAHLFLRAVNRSRISHAMLAPRTSAQSPPRRGSTSRCFLPHACTRLA